MASDWNDPGDDNIMAPFRTGDRDKMLLTNPNPRLSAVVMLLFPKNGLTHFALIRRPDYDGVHSGQMAFPGGKMDDSDSDLNFTATRELQEEVGIHPSEVSLIGELEKVYIPPSKFLVTPFIGMMPDYPTFVKDDYEVAQIVEVPITQLFDESNVKQGTVNVGPQNMKMRVPYFDLMGHMVWGATAIMLNDFKMRMK